MAQTTTFNYLSNDKEKMGLVIQCSYKNTQYALPGTVADCAAFEKKLNRHGYNVKVLRDDMPVRYTVPTKANIIEEMKAMNAWLNARPHRQGWIVFAGHGTQQIDRTGEEKDGKDEAIVPADFQKNGLIKDDVLKEINGTITQPTSSLMIFFDCCHSETMMDMPYKLTHKLEGPEYPPGNLDKLGKVFCVSAALDAQVAYETSEGGVCTRAFLGSHVAGGNPAKLLMAMQNYADRKGMPQKISMHSTHPFGEGDAEFIEAPATNPFEMLLDCFFGGTTDSRNVDAQRALAAGQTRPRRPNGPPLKPEELAKIKRAYADGRLS